MMKNKVLSALMYLAMSFILALVVNILLGMILHREGGLIDWMTVVFITAFLMIFNIRAIGRMADRMEKEGFSGALKWLFTDEKKH